METLLENAIKNFNFEQTIVIIVIIGFIQYFINKTQTRKLGTNHFAHVENRLELIDKSLNHCKESSDSLKRIEEKMDKMNDNLVYLRARLNGKKYG